MLGIITCKYLSNYHNCRNYSCRCVFFLWGAKTQTKKTARPPDLKRNPLRLFLTNYCLVKWPLKFINTCKWCSDKILSTTASSSVAGGCIDGYEIISVNANICVVTTCNFICITRAASISVNQSGDDVKALNFVRDSTCMDYRSNNAVNKHYSLNLSFCTTRPRLKAAIETRTYILL